MAKPNASLNPASAPDGCAAGEKATPAWRLSGYL